jgi:hypothetical protein
MRIIGVDPGKVTGICSFYLDEYSEHPELVTPYELELSGVGQYFQNQLGSFNTVVACEAFIITPQTAKNSQAPWSLETIGIVRYFCEKASVPFFLQAPSSAKRLVTDGVLKRAGLYFPGKGHSMDAARHALYLAMTSYGFMQHSLKVEEE